MEIHKGMVGIGNSCAIFQSSNKNKNLGKFVPIECAYPPKDIFK